MQRREFISLLGAASFMANPLAAHAQQPRRIGWLVGLAEQDPEAQRRNASGGPRPHGAALRQRGDPLRVAHGESGAAKSRPPH